MTTTTQARGPRPALGPMRATTTSCTVLPSGMAANCTSGSSTLQDDSGRRQVLELGCGTGSFAADSPKERVGRAARHGIGRIEGKDDLERASRKTRRRRWQLTFPRSHGEGVQFPEHGSRRVQYMMLIIAAAGRRKSSGRDGKVLSWRRGLVADSGRRRAMREEVGALHRHGSSRARKWDR